MILRLGDPFDSHCQEAVDQGVRIVGSGIVRPKHIPHADYRFFYVVEKAEYAVLSNRMFSTASV